MENNLNIDTKFVRTYIRYLETNDKSLEEISFAVLDLSSEKEWDDIWTFLVLVSNLEDKIADLTLATIAAGPLEDLLNGAGNTYISRVLELAKSNRRFAKLLTGVWRSSIEPDVWQKVIEFCRTFDEPIDGEYHY